MRISDRQIGVKSVNHHKTNFVGTKKINKQGHQYAKSKLSATYHFHTWTLHGKKYTKTSGQFYSKKRDQDNFIQKKDIRTTADVFPKKHSSSNWKLLAQQTSGCSMT
jgi:hypothetical protein